MEVPAHFVRNKPETVCHKICETHTCNKIHAISLIEYQINEINLANLIYNTIIESFFMGLFFGFVRSPSLTNLHRYNQIILRSIDLSI